MKLLLFLPFLLTACATTAQIPDAPLPYREIPPASETATAGTALARLIDGLGYRYYWATEDLRPEDLDYRPSEDSRSSREILEHLYNLARTIDLAVVKEANIRPLPPAPESFVEQRRLTLEKLKHAADLMRTATDEEVQTYEMRFQRGEQVSAFPLWNLINGPIADALTHVGQITSFRRASGNPQHPGVNVFMGKTRE